MFLLPKVVFDFLNALVYVVLVNLISKAVLISEKSLQDNKKQYMVTFLMFLLMWFFVPNFSGVVTWLTGSITYLWMNCLVMICGLLYYSNFIHVNDADNDIKKKDVNIIKIMGYIFIGFCAGCSSETSACTLIFALFLYVMYCFRHNKKMFLHEWCGIVFVIIGFLILMLAPGNYERVAYVKSVSESANWLFNYIFRIGRETFYTLRFMTIPLATEWALFCVSRRSCKIKMKEALYEIMQGKELFFLILSFVSIYVMTFSAGFAIRIFQFSSIMLFISMGISICKVYDMFYSKSEIVFSLAYKVFSKFLLVLLLFVLVEIITGTLYVRQSGSFFEREMYYYYINDKTTSDLLSGNGINK